jgi:hypothetical protein
VAHATVEAKRVPPLRPSREPVEKYRPVRWAKPCPTKPKELTKMQRRELSNATGAVIQGCLPDAPAPAATTRRMFPTPRKSLTAHMRSKPRALVIAATLCLGSAAGTAQVMPTNISVASSPTVIPQLGNANDAYWLIDDRWGAGSITEGTASTQYQQAVGVSPTVGTNGEVAFRMNWRWPSPAGSNEVKGFPSIVSGRKPGYYSSDSLVDGNPVRLPDGSTSQISPAGYTPGTFFPLQLPLQSLTAKTAFKHLTPPTGLGQLTFDIWLQSSPTQDHLMMQSSITHEIMIPLDNWGGYGTTADRNPGWYDHDATIGGKLYHVYATKGSDGALLYNFGSLAGAYGRTGWKMIAFLPDVMPVAPGEIDLAAIINYVATRKDVMGNPWAQGNEYVADVELGVEPIVGTGDIEVYNYKISTGASAPAPVPVAAPAPAPAPAPVASTCTYKAWVQGQYYATGSVVSYGGVLYVAKRANPGYNPKYRYFWSRYYC